MNKKTNLEKITGCNLQLPSFKSSFSKGLTLFINFKKRSKNKKFSQEF